MIHTLVRDLRFGLRLLLKSPGFSAVSIMTLALGIGATAGMFSVVNGVLLRRLPYKNPETLVLIEEAIPKITAEASWIPAPDVISFQEETSSFEGVGGFLETQMDLTGVGSPLRIDLARVSWNTFQVLGVPPLLGRTFSPEEDRPGSYVAVLSHTCWLRRFGGAPDVLGKTVELDRKTYTIIGVMPPGFTIPLETPYPEPVELWIPMAFTEREKAARASLFMYGAIARLKPGVGLAQAQSDVGSVMAHIRDGYPASVRDLGTTAAVIPLAQETYRTLRRPLYFLLAAAGVLLLIALANVANLMLARGFARQKELAIRIALGASGRSLLAQLLTESVLLGLVGGAIGVILAAIAVRLLLSEAAVPLPRLGISGLDIRVLLAAFGISAAGGLLFGAAPGFFALRSRLNDNLKEGGRSGGQGRQHHILRAGFVVVQIALALMLLVGSGLLIRSFQRVIAVDGGFRGEHVEVGSLFLSTTGYPESKQVQNFLTELLARMKAIPGARSAAVSTDLPLKGGWYRLVVPQDYDPPPGAEFTRGLYSVVQGDYFQTLRIPLLEGRFFSPEEAVNGSHSVIISEYFAKQYFPGRDPVGRRLKFIAQQQKTSWLDVIGVVGDVKQEALEEEPVPHTYATMTAEDIPILQRIGGVSVNLSVRTAGDPSSAGASLQSAVWSLDRQLPVTELMTMEQVLNSSTASRRFTMVLVISFAAAALLLASIGLYGVMEYSVSQRVHEIGIRMALGAGRAGITRMVLGWGLMLTLIGIGFGLAFAATATQLLKASLFGVTPLDPLTFSGVAVVLCVVALLACYLPALRATRVDPIIALRSE